MADKEGKKTGGRKKGVPNKDNELKSWVRTLLGDNTERLEAELSKLDGKDYVNTYISLMDFAVPKMQRVEVDGKVDATIFTIGFGETKEG